jgi:Fe2+ transport system protein B
MTRLWDKMQKEHKKYNSTPFRLFSYVYKEKPSFHISSSSSTDNSFGDTSVSPSTSLQPVDHLSLVQETVQKDEESKERHSSFSSSKKPSTKITLDEKLENSFAQRYIDEIASKTKMKEYQTIAVKEKENLLKEAKLLHHKYNTEVIQSQQIENTVMNISSLVGEFATLIQSQSHIVETIGETTEDVSKNVKSTDDELLTTIERSQSHSWNMIVLILFFSFLLFLLHFITP